jgi:hypothetical protein
MLRQMNNGSFISNLLYGFACVQGNPFANRQPKEALRTDETRLLLGEAGTELAGSAVTRPDE